MRTEETQNFIEQHIDDDTKLLALKYRGKISDIDLNDALDQISAFQYINKKIPSWSKHYMLQLPSRLSLEQASSEITARWKKGIVERWAASKHSMIDLTGGMGIDCFFLSECFDNKEYVEQNEILYEKTSWNYKVLNAGIETHCCDAMHFLKKNNHRRWDLIYLDPARRGNKGQKVYSIEDCTPNLIDIQDQLIEKACIVMVKLSPMLDISLALSKLKHVAEIDIVSVGNECKELVFVLKKDFYGEPQIVAENIGTNGMTSSISNTLTAENELCNRIAQNVGRYIYEPYSSILKAGLYKTLSEKFKIDKLNPNSHLYTSDIFIPDFPGRCFEVQEVLDFNKKNIKSLSLIKKANIAVRNFPLTSEEFRKRLKLTDGGDVYLYGTTLKKGEKVVVVTNKK